MKDSIRQLVKKSLEEIGISVNSVVVEHTADFAHGDYATNVALAYAKIAKTNPKALAETLRLALMKELAQGEIGISKIEVAGAGFINFYLSERFLGESVQAILRQAQDFGKNKIFASKKVMVEYTDPNPFKEFHIGHLMSNTIGEAISRLVASRGAEVKRACYQGDVGLHVAKALYGARELKPNTAEEWGRAYTSGATAYEENESAKKEIEVINKAVYERNDHVLNSLYDAGRKVSFGYFETIYKRLGTHFDFNFFESETGVFGKEVVEKNTPSVFEKSDGAIVYKGEKVGLHTRVFINSQGLPTYEAKELGLAKKKYDTYQYDESVVITGNEVNEYFKVLLSAMKEVFPELAVKTVHKSHGMLRLPTGKMSSRTGSVITAESLIGDVKKMVEKKIADRELSAEEKEKISEAVAIGAIKYSILRQTVGGDIIFDFDKSISFEGDSGPYLQYTYVRARSVLSKHADTTQTNADITQTEIKLPENLELLRRLVRFPDVVARSAEEYSPHYLVTYLTELASAFNAFYANTKIIGSPDEASLLALTQAVSIVLKNGLTTLGMPVVERM